MYQALFFSLSNQWNKEANNNNAWSQVSWSLQKATDKEMYLKHTHNFPCLLVMWRMNYVPRDFNTQIWKKKRIKIRYLSVLNQST